MNSTTSSVHFHAQCQVLEEGNLALYAPNCPYPSITATHNCFTKLPALTLPSPLSMKPSRRSAVFHHCWSPTMVSTILLVNSSVPLLAASDSLPGWIGAEHNWGQGVGGGGLEEKTNNFIEQYGNMIGCPSSFSHLVGFFRTWNYDEAGTIPSQWNMKLMFTT